MTSAAPFSPPPLRSQADAGLPSELLSDLILKTAYFAGSISSVELSAALRLPFSVISRLVQEFVEQAHLTPRTVSDASGRPVSTFSITQKGEERARRMLEISEYTGAAPVPLEAYVASVQRQAQLERPPSTSQMRAAFRDLVLSAEFLDLLGPAISTQGSLFLYGAPGNGKTAVAQRIANLMGDEIYIPYAISVDRHIIRLFDEAFHTPVSKSGDGQVDPRWVRIRRPVIRVGGELTLANLDLIYEPTVKFYEAPPQIKANNGVFIIDDFGRQLVSPTELLNRWIVPLAEHVDYLSLHTGQRLQVPLSAMIIFATNLPPEALLVDEAFLRRIRFKLEMGDPDPATYKEIFRRACLLHHVPYQEEAVTYLLEELYPRSGFSPRASHPGDLVQQLVAICRYAGQRPELTPALLDRAWRSFFASLGRVAG